MRIEQKQKAVFIALLLLFITTTFTAIAGCGGGGGGGGGVTATTPPSSQMESKSYMCRAVSITYGGRWAQSSNYQCSASVTNPSDSSISTAHSVRSGVQNVINGVK